MDRYFTTRQGAIRRLIEIKCANAGTTYSPIIVVGWHDGLEVSGADSVLLNVRAGRLFCFVHSGTAEDQIVFIS